MFRSGFLETIAISEYSTMTIIPEAIILVFAKYNSMIRSAVPKLVKYTRFHELNY